MGDLTIWEHFGFPGVVIGACFIGMFFLFDKLIIPLIESLKDQLTKQSASHNEEIRELIKIHQEEMAQLVETHRQERSEWRETYIQQSKESVEVVRELAKAVHEMNSRHRKFDKPSENNG